MYNLDSLLADTLNCRAMSFGAPRSVRSSMPPPDASSRPAQGNSGVREREQYDHYRDHALRRRLNSRLPESNRRTVSGGEFHQAMNLADARLVVVSLDDVSLG